MQSDGVKVTIMIPTYNQEDYVIQAVESALMQDYKNIEVLVVDDCSNDDTQEVMQRYKKDHRLKYIRNRYNLGRVRNYHNILYTHATGDWVVNLDGDDYYVDKTFISTAIKDIQKASEHTEVVAYLFGQKIRKIKKKYEYIDISENSILISGKDYFLNYYKIGNFVHMNTIYRRDIAITLDCYTKLYQASDFQSLMRIFLLGNIILNENKIGVWRVHGNNTTIKEVSQKQQQAMETFADIELFARSFFSLQEMQVWRNKMHKLSYKDYVATYIHSKRDLKGAFLLLRTFRFQYGYFRLLFYYLFHY